MSMSNFITPEPYRLTLSDGQTVDIKRRLNHGETEDMLARISPYGVGVNRREVRTAKIAAYLIGWSLTDDAGTPVPMTAQGGELPEDARVDTIRSLDPDRAVEIHKAIEAHEAAEDTRRAEQKKTSGGSRPAATTSPSPSGPVSPSERSEP